LSILLIGVLCATVQLRLKQDLCYATANMKTTCLLFLVLQVADFVTTAMVLRMGGAETNPIVRHFMTADPLQGLLLAKVLALAIGGICLFGKKYRAMRLTNVAFTGVVAWNVSVMARLMH
jgi:Domain of unknown function (DUF5658)